MENLLFHVKHGPLTHRVSWIFLILSIGVACGYAPKYGSRRDVRLSVAPAAHRVAEIDVVDATLDGVRAELSRAGALGPGGAYPRLVVEVVRVDEVSAGIALSPDAGPLARGSAVAVVARAWVIPSVGARSERDTGDIRRVEHVMSDVDSRHDATHYHEALRSAAKGVGRALARRVLGGPEPAEEPL